MKPVGDVLTHQPHILPESCAPANNEPPPCPRCMGAGVLRLDRPYDDPGFAKLVPCDCTKAARAERRAKAISDKAGLGAYATKTFESFKVGVNRELTDVRDAAHNLATRRTDGRSIIPPWLILTGGVGTGKTHLAAATVNARVSAGRPAVFCRVPDLLDRIRATYNNDGGATYEEVTDAAREAEFLVLDDLGTQKPSEWVAEKLFQLLDYRYSQEHETLITTNATVDTLGPRLASRLSDIRLTRTVHIGGHDFRQTKLQEVTSNH